MSGKRFTWPDGFGPEGDEIQTQLFDVAEREELRRPRAPKPLPPGQAVAVVTGPYWRITSSRTHRACCTGPLTTRRVKPSADSSGWR
jgi:hypothetical protein